VSPAKAAEQPNGHHAAPKARAEPDSKADAPGLAAAAPGSDSPSKGAASPPKEKEAAEVTSSGSSTSKAEMEMVVGAQAPVAERSEKISEDKQPPPTSVDDPAEGAEERANSVRLVADDSHADLERIRRAAEEKVAERTVRAPLPPPRHPRPVRSTERQALSDLSSLEKTPHSPGSKPVKSEEPEFAQDGTPYVGDGTWEERTWKELVRLREEMFWARVGGAQ
jgi:Rab guanine nucleotide exchange factor SEC2